jgi:exodeoxyribonuclease-5
MTTTLHVWNAQQAAALDAVGKWLRDPNAPQVLRLFGYAGTGKTTLARHLAALQDGPVYFAAFTGKAAAVLREAGCPNATTLHSLIYLPFDKSRAKLDELKRSLDALSPSHPDFPEAKGDYEAELYKVRTPGFNLNPDAEIRGAKLVVVDEVSMVDKKLGRDLESFGTKILVLGDPAQLPPVDGAGYFTNATPDILLTEIHRQAADNPIIRWATAVRRGELLPFGDAGRAKKIKRDRMSPEVLSTLVDAILTGKNETRRTINAKVRKHRKFSSVYPMKGDALICLMNKHDLGFLNGVVCRASNDAAQVSDEMVMMDVLYEGRNYTSLACDAAIFRGEEGDWTRKYLQFDYGYAMTVHKAQGSQWRRVAIWDDGFGKREPVQRRRWLYTAITRAQEELIIVAG